MKEAATTDDKSLLNDALTHFLILALGIPVRKDIPG